MIQIQELSFSVGEFQLKQNKLKIVEGEYFVLLGRPGSGKTTFLECLCGLNRPQSGKIYIAGEDVTNLEPRKRKIGYVPQDYALFSHLSVEKNIGFALKSRKVDRNTIVQKVSEKASLLGIEHLLKREVKGLSGGEKQRVALARALVMEPKVLLLDEPVSALDENMRNSVCIELRRLQKNLGITTIHICHNLEEAFTVADTGGILNNGTFEQLGAPNELLQHPANEFCARFMRCENFFKGKVKGTDPIDNRTCLNVNGAEFIVPGKYTGEIHFIVRPENIQLRNIDDSTVQNRDNVFPVKLMRVVNRGVYMRLDFLGKFPLSVHITHYMFSKLNATEESELLAIIDMKMIHIYSREN